MSLYNIRTTAKGFYITKFDADLNVMSAYNLTATECECPQGIKPTCRHRKMLPLMQDRADTAWFFNYEHGQWVDPTGQAEAETDEDTLIEPTDHSEAIIAADIKINGPSALTSGKSESHAPNPAPKPGPAPGYERQGTGYDSGAAGHELQGRAAKPSAEALIKRRV